MLRDACGCGGLIDLPAEAVDVVNLFVNAAVCDDILENEERSRGEARLTCLNIQRKAG
jgi:hypothetical protein